MLHSEARTIKLRCTALNFDKSTQKNLGQEDEEEAKFTSTELRTSNGKVHGGLMG